MRGGPGSPAEILASVPFAERTLPGLLESRRSTALGQVAVEIEGRPVTWAEIDSHSAMLAAGLASLGVSAGDVVCQVAANTVEHVMMIFAVARLGAIECPVNTGLRGEPLRHVLSHSGARTVVAEEEFLEPLEPALADADSVQAVVVRGSMTETGKIGGVLKVAEADLPAERPSYRLEVRPSDPATIMYTSGTTGPAKGVVLPHHFAFSTAAVRIGTWGLTAEDVLFSPLPLFHANARFSTLLTACILGARAVVVDRFSASRFWEQVRLAEATEVGTVGTVAPILLERPPDARDRDHRVRMMHGAGALPPARREEFEERFGLRLVTGFSMTETSHFSTTSPEDPGRYLGAGRPVAGFDVAILDDDDILRPSGEVGEIAVRPRIPFSMFLRYHRQPEETLESFRNLWFHTGDLGYLDEAGYLHWVDRRKDAIRRKGEMISSRDVEAAALAFEDVVEAAAIGVPSSLGEEEVMLVVRLGQGASAALEDLEMHCRKTLPDFAVPRYYEVVEDFPRTSTHKIDKKQLRDSGVGERTWDAADPTRTAASPSASTEALK